MSTEFPELTRLRAENAQLHETGKRKDAIIAELKNGLTDAAARLDEALELAAEMEGENGRK